MNLDLKFCSNLPAAVFGKAATFGNIHVREGEQGNRKIALSAMNGVEQ